MSIADTVRGSLGAYLRRSITAKEDSEHLAAFGMEDEALGPLVDKVSKAFAPDYIRDLATSVNLGMTLDQLISTCRTNLDINEVDRMMKVLMEMRDLEAPPPMSTKLYDHGITDENRDVLITRLQREFSLYDVWRLNIRASDINKLTTLLMLLRLIESNLVRTWK